MKVYAALFLIISSFSFVSSLELLQSLRHIMGQGISTTQFYFYGRKHFTQTGYQKHIAKYTSPRQASASIRPGEEGADDVNLDGKVVVITG